MKRFFGISTLLILILCALPPAGSQSVRPVRDDVGFCWDRRQFDGLIKYLEKAEHMRPHHLPVVAGVCPHDDYLYAGRMYVPLMRSIKAKEVVIFGVTHKTVRDSLGDLRGVVILDTHSAWQGASEKVPISPLRGEIRKRLDSSMVKVSDVAQRLEHSIEALVPFIRHYNPNASITPIMVTVMTPGRMDTVSTALSAVIAEYMKTRHLVPGKDIVFLMSSDANHYGDDFRNTPFGADSVAHDKATKQDVALASKDLTGTMTLEKIADLSESLKSILWCGKYSVPFGMMTTMKAVKAATGKDLRGELLKYGDTWTGGVLPFRGRTLGTTAPFSLRHWVGFFSTSWSLE